MTLREILLEYVKDKNEVTSQELLQHAVRSGYSPYTAYLEIRTLVLLGVLSPRMRTKKRVVIYKVNHEIIKKLGMEIRR